MKLSRTISKVQKGDTIAFKAIVLSFSSRLMTIAKIMTKNSQDAQDVLQESFISIYENIKKFEGNNENAFFAWMRKIVVNKSLAYYKRKYYTHENRIEIQDIYSLDPAVYRMLEQKEIIQSIYQLPIKYRQVICLFALEGYSHAEIAKKMSITESTSRSNYTRAKKKLEKLIRNQQNACYKLR